MMFSSTPESPFSTTISERHKYMQKTYGLNVPFFVSNKYAGLNAREKHNIHNQVEREYLQKLQTQCETE